MSKAGEAVQWLRVRERTAEVGSLMGQSIVESGALVTAHTELTTLQTALDALPPAISQNLNDAISAVKVFVLRVMNDALGTVREHNSEVSQAGVDIYRHRSPPSNSSGTFSAPDRFSYNSGHASSFE